jgi:hypothetical protein
MKINILILTFISFCLQPVIVTAAEILPAEIKWPTGAEALIDKAIEIKVKAQKQNIEMFSEGGEYGHAFTKCMDELSQILSENSFSLDQLKEIEGSDLKAKIALWSIDRRMRSEEYARLEHLHVSDNPIGKAAAERKSFERRRARGEDGDKAPVSPDGQPLRRPQPPFHNPPRVAKDDIVEANRWILEYLYFAPPIDKREWQMENRFPLILALTSIRNEKSLVMLKFDLEVQLEGFPEWKKDDVGLDAKYILDFSCPSAFTIVASMMHHEGVRMYVSRFISFLSNIHPSDTLNPWYSRLEDFRKLANMEWQTDAEKELASWMKKIK